LSKQTLLVLVVTGALFLASVVGYVGQSESSDPPVRVFLDNTGGRVVFGHLAHVEDYGLECEDCHHDGEAFERPMECGACHPKAFDEAFAQNHQQAFSDPEQCLRCHYDDPATEAPEDRPDPYWIAVRADAFHSQCMGCHESMGGPAGDESCNQCHAGM